jgi:dolichol-phosphate mannosyltransferase
MKNTLVAVPVFNEQRYLPHVIEAIRRYAGDMLIIDDGSTDATPSLLAARDDIHVIRHPENRGYGQSLIDAFSFADRHGYDWVITIDCDEQHEPACIPDFLAEIARDQADIISGSRYLTEDLAHDPPPIERRRINHTCALLIAQILGLRLTDAFCGFKAHRTAAMRRLSLDEPGYAFPLQFWVQCVRAGLRIRELAVPRIYRDTSREFGGTLDDPAARLQHYLCVFLRELRREPVATLSEVQADQCR